MLIIEVPKLAFPFGSSFVCLRQTINFLFVSFFLEIHFYAFRNDVLMMAYHTVSVIIVGGQR